MSIQTVFPRPVSVRILAFGFLTVFCGGFSADSAAGDDGFRSIFDGKTLDGWDGNPKFWRVEGGVLTGQTTQENPTKGNTFIIWRGTKPSSLWAQAQTNLKRMFPDGNPLIEPTAGVVANFELKLEYKIVGGNSGIQYRSFELPEQKWVVGGYQADFEAGDTYSGILYSEKARGILALRGEETVIGTDGKPRVVGKIGESADIQAKIKKEDWNQYHIIARDNHFIHKINGVTTVVVTDHDVVGPKRRTASGILALQLHAGPPMKVQFRNIRIKTLPATTTSSGQGTAISPQPRSRTPSVQTINKRKITLVAGKRSHGYGAHEHRAGCLLLAKALNESGLPVKAEVYTGGWPKDDGGFADADTIVIYADGGEGHPINAHLDELDKLMKQGAGMVCIHYAVEVPKGKSGNAFLDWIGGYFETDWSVNPHWTANYRKFPNHPIANGVRPFSINDEWYYHMRFRTPPQSLSLKGGDTGGVIPILTDLPSAETLLRRDGPHSGNQFVRAEIAKGTPQHLAWARERPDGGRGFGFTGGHDHWNWGNDDFRKLVLNAIVWTAHAEVPQGGVPSNPLSIKDLMAHQDYEAPADFNPARIQAMLDEWKQ